MALRFRVQGLALAHVPLGLRRDGGLGVGGGGWGDLRRGWGDLRRGYITCPPGPWTGRAPKADVYGHVRS